MRVVGLDLSLSSSGYAVGRTEYGRIEPPKHSNRGPERLDYILRRVLELVAGADLVVIEGYANHSPGGAASVRGLAELGGLVRWALWKKRIRYVDIPPNTLKVFATGKGNADKHAIVAEAVRRLDYQGSKDDEADAIWLRELGLYLVKQPAVFLPQSHQRALEGWDGTTPPPPKKKQRARRA